MLDQVLSWFVLVVPVALGLILILVPAKREDPEGHMRWRIVLGACLVVYGGITWWQQSRVTKASTKEREEAVTKVSEKVAAETSKQVTAMVSDLYSHVISDQKTQIAGLEAELKTQGKSLNAIRGSDLLSGKKPVKVEVTNPGPTSVPPGPVLSGVRIASQKQIPSDDSNLPFGLELVLQTDVDIMPVKFAVLCDGPIGKARAEFEGGGSYTMISEGLAEGNDTIFVTKWETPAWTPQKPIVVRLFSKTGIHAIGLSRNVF